MGDTHDATTADRICSQCNAPLGVGEYNPCNKCWSAKYGGKQWSGQYVQACEHSPHLFIESSRVRWYIGPARMVAEAEPDLVVNCSISSVQNGASYPEGYTELADHDRRSYREIFLDWPDYAPPPFRVTFWRTLFDLVEADPKVSRVYVCCSGGHGRSGTAAACLITAGCAMRPKEAIAFLRKNYCKLAVESKTQEAYVENLVKEEEEKDNDRPKGSIGKSRGKSARRPS